MAPCMKANTWQARSMVEEFIAGMMVLGIMESGKRIRSKDWELTRGSMADNMKESGSIITWTV